ncbi:MAG: hypothetical protein EA397_05010 [Deltaproteobacteria bacterium]|nr:MAG: hypothetical protein EA397_05010 [Deltaproteobacteria bacterium]
MSRFLALTALLVACNFGGSTLTVEKLESAKESTPAMQPKERAQENLTKALGEPASSDDDHMTWYAPDGDKCRMLKVNFMGTVVGQVELKRVSCPE